MVRRTRRPRTAETRGRTVPGLLFLDELNALAGRFCPSNARISLDIAATLITSWPTLMSSGKKVTLMVVFWLIAILFFQATLNLSSFAPRSLGAAVPIRVCFLPVTSSISRTLP